MKILNLIIFLVFSLFFGSCDKSNSASIDNQYSVTVQSDSNVNANAKPTIEDSLKSENSTESNNSNSPVQEIEDEIPATPEKTVQAFYKALKERNSKIALKYAKPNVVRQLLKDRESKLDWRFVDCSEPKIKEYGDIICFYFFEGGGIGIFLRKNSKEKYQIVSTYYMAAD